MPALPAAPLYLEPRLAPRLMSLLASGDFLHPLVDGLGTPLNVVLPEQVAENVRRFHSVFRRHHLRGAVHFAHKANRSSALVRRLASTDASLDVASLEELQHALSCGFTPERIGATGPKEPEFLWLAARTGVTVNVEGAAELDALGALVRRHRLRRARVLLRLSDFAGERAGGGVRLLSRRSRFGTPVSALDALLKVADRHRDAVEIAGVAYHLDTTSLQEKAAALEGCVRAMTECLERGLRPTVIDIGGGFGVNYLAHETQWETYTTQLTLSALGRRPPMTWRRHGYGLSNDAGTLRGSLELYPSYRQVAGADYLDALLAQAAPSLGRPLGEVLLEHLFDLSVEPGRALVDQCGATLARVLEVRGGDEAEEVLTVRLGMNADDCALEEHGILLDPVLVPRPAAGRRETRDEDARPVRVYLHGNLCLESDLITRRVVHLPRRPAPGDLLAFPNTAGYCMDFNASHAQRRPPARKAAVHHEDGGWRWSLDDLYWPLHVPEDPAADSVAYPPAASTADVHEGLHEV